MITVNKGDLATSHFSNPRTYANVVLQQANSGFYDRFLPFMKDKIVIDAGANVGIFSILASKEASVVLSVEPTTSHQEVFTELMAENNVDNVVLLKAALTEGPKEVTLYESAGNSTMNSLFAYGPNISKTYTVRGITLPNILETYKEVGFFKLDIEGSEKYLYASDVFFKALNSVDSIFMEVHEVDGKSFDQLTLDWITKLSAVYPNVERIGVDGVFAYR